MLLVRSSDQPASAAASGSIDWRAVKPAGSNVAVQAANTARLTTLTVPSPNNQAISGTAAPAAPESRSDTSDTVRRPKKSTAVPATRVDSTSGSVAAAETTAASSALPCRCNTSQGKATMDMP